MSFGTHCRTSLKKKAKAFFQIRKICKGLDVGTLKILCLRVFLFFNVVGPQYQTLNFVVAPPSAVLRVQEQKGNLAKGMPSAVSGNACSPFRWLGDASEDVTMPLTNDRWQRGLHHACSDCYTFFRNKNSRACFAWAETTATKQAE